MTELELIAAQGRVVSGAHVEVSGMVHKGELRGFYRKDDGEIVVMVALNVENKHGATMIRSLAAVSLIEAESAPQVLTHA